MRKIPLSVVQVMTRYKEKELIFKGFNLSLSDLDLSLASSMLAMFSLFLMVMGSVCIIMSLTKNVPFLLKPASVCFLISGEPDNL